MRMTSILARAIVLLSPLVYGETSVVHHSTPGTPRSSHAVPTGPKSSGRGAAVHHGLVKEPQINSLLRPVNCTYSNVSIPLGRSGLPQPPAGQQLLHIAIGRGTLNYTCDTSDSSATPVEVGALATLYDTFCLATRYPDIHRLLPDIALQLSLPTNITGTPTSVPALLNYYNRGLIVGHLYNSDSTTVQFPIDTQEYGYFGKVRVQVVANVNAPSWAPVGQFPYGAGAAPWQYYGYVNGTIGNVRYVYRINTAGGQAPSTCEGQAAEFGVEYAAEYWFYGAPGKTG